MRLRTILLAALAVGLLGVLVWVEWPAAALIPKFTTAVGKYHPPLETRIVSFHRGRADKNLILLAHYLGFNGVEFQIEGENVAGLMDFAERDAKEHYVDYCHSLGMKVTVWVHELSDLPEAWLPNYPGPVSADNEKLWSYLSGRYEWLLTKIVPNVDGLTLTVVETDVRATSAPILGRVVRLIRDKCRQHDKTLTLRTFVWTPDEFDGVMKAVREVAPDVTIMSKIVPQDWQMRGAFAAEIGAVGDKRQIIEFDAAGEYFLRDSVANCMVDLLKKQMDYARSKGASGICVRVDREDDSLLFSPNEVNLWALGMYASGAADSPDDVWNAWADYHYGKAAAPAVIAALRHSSEVVAEELSIGPFTFGDTRNFPPQPNDDPFNQNWQNWKWDKSYAADHDAAERGDPAFTEKVAQQKAAAAATAAECLAALENARPRLPDADYQILRSKLLTNQMQLSLRAPMALAALHYRAYTYGPAEGRDAAKAGYAKDLADVRAAIAQVPDPGTLLNWKSRVWRVGSPDGIDRNAAYKWLYNAEKLIAVP